MNFNKRKRMTAEDVKRRVAEEKTQKRLSTSEAIADRILRKLASGNFSVSGNSVLVFLWLRQWEFEWKYEIDPILQEHGYCFVEYDHGFLFYSWIFTIGFVDQP